LNFEKASSAMSARAARLPRIINVDDAVWRQRVIERLTSAPPKTARLTYLTAPAGYGKTTTMAQLTQVFLRENAKVAWLNCDERDSDQVIFSESLASALSRSGLKLAAKVSAGSLLSRISDVDDALLICIDDFEHACSPSVDGLIARLVDLLPAHISIVICSRKPPSHQLTCLQLAGKARIVDAETLRFTYSEAEELLQDVVPHPMVAQISNYSDGWPFALQLARLKASSTDGTLEKGMAPNGKIPRKQIFDYLANEVLSTIAAPLRKFLEDVAVLDMIDVDSANAVRESTDSLGHIQQLCNIRPIAALEEETWTARLHPLLRDYLIDALDVHEPGRVSQHHVRAARHMAATGNLHQAVAHAVSGERLEMAASIIEEAGAIRLIATEGVVRARLILNMLPEGVIRKHPRLRMLQFCHYLTEGQPSAAEADFESIEQQIREQFDVVPPALTYELELARCLLLIHAADHAECFDPWPVLARAKDVVRNEAVDDPRLLSIILPVEIYFLHRFGPMERCDRRIDAIVQLGDRGAYTNNSPWIQMYHARSALAKGNLEQAARTISDSLSQDVNFIRFRQDSLAQLVTTVLGHICYLRGELDSAVAHFTELVHCNTTFRLEICHARYIALARCYAARGEWDRALDLLNDARTLAFEESLPQFNTDASAAYVELLSMRAPAEASSLASEIGLERLWAQAISGQVLPWVVVEGIARARYFLGLAVGEPDLAIETAKELKILARRQGFRATEIMADLMQLQLIYCEPHDKASGRKLGEILQETRDKKLIQPFIELGTRTMGCLGLWLSQRPLEPGGTETALWATHLVNSINRAYRERTQLVAGKLFTPREVDVLCELAKSNTTKAIAKNLALSPETIKHHLKAIFAKLAVRNREDAIRAARARRLIA
jgi:LuxR family maltose regulon positive regulatory protein